MTPQHLDFLEALEAHAQRVFSRGGQHSLHRSGTIIFREEEVYFRKGQHPEVVVLVALGITFDCVIWDS